MKTGKRILLNVRNENLILRETYLSLPAAAAQESEVNGKVQENLQKIA
jgi:hypothetical protein